MLKPAKILGSAVFSFFGKLTGNPHLLNIAANMDPVNTRAKLYLLQHKNLSRENYYRVVFETFDLFKFINTGLAQHAQHNPELVRSWPKSESELYQDLFVLSEHHFKRDGFFVEIGVGNGQKISNTYLLEKEFGWRGLLVEPNRDMAASIKATRQAVLDQRAVFSKTGLELDFLSDAAEVELSTLVDFKGSDQRHRSGRVFKVPTITLNDLLAEHEAPKTIDYLSLDTEGSELDILRTFDFERYQVAIITVEHNYNQGKLLELKNLMESHGFVQVIASCSKWDAWFVAESLGPQWSGRPGSVLTPASNDPTAAATTTGA